MGRGPIFWDPHPRPVAETHCSPVVTPRNQEPTMSLPHADHKPDRDVQEIEVQQADEKNFERDLVSNDKDLMNEAFAAEDAEHNMGMLEAVRAYPMACFWAFIMAFTIVSG